MTARFAILALLVPASVAAETPTTPAAVLVRPVERGEILSVDDFAVQPTATGLASGALPPAAAAGREALRSLSVGSVVRAGDLIAPRLVRRGEPVTITLRAGGLAIASAGRALASGGAGDLVRVVSSATNRTLDGVVEGTGAVRIAAPF
jgi:flagella basal body P-ring formation protein FlgA